MLEVLIARGLVPPDTEWPPAPLSEEGCPSGTYVEVTDGWLRRIDLDWEDTSALIAARSAFLSGAQSEQTCAELRDG